MIPTEILRKGSTGEPVILLQKALQEHGHQLIVDGDFGPITDLSVRQFQETRGLKVDGVVGPATWAALDIEQAPPPSPESIIYIDIMYGLGDSLTSAGMNVLAAALRALSPRLIVHPTWSWSEREKVAARIANRPDDSRNILIGNSMGANAIPMVTAMLPRKTFELCIGYDPTWAWSCPPLTANIKKMIHFKGTFLFSLIGKADYTPAFVGQIVKMNTKTPHGWIDDDLKLHAVSINGVKQRLAA